MCELKVMEAVSPRQYGSSASPAGHSVVVSGRVNSSSASVSSPVLDSHQRSSSDSSAVSVRGSTAASQLLLSMPASGHTALIIEPAASARYSTGSIPKAPPSQPATVTALVLPEAPGWSATMKMLWRDAKSDGDKDKDEDSDKDKNESAVDVDESQLSERISTNDRRWAEFAQKQPSSALVDVAALDEHYRLGCMSMVVQARHAYYGFLLWQTQDLPYYHYTTVVPTLTNLCVALLTVLPGNVLTRVLTPAFAFLVHGLLFAALWPYVTWIKNVAFHITTIMLVLQSTAAAGLVMGLTPPAAHAPLSTSVVQIQEQLVTEAVAFFSNNMMVLGVLVALAATLTVVASSSAAFRWQQRRLASAEQDKSYLRSKQQRDYSTTSGISVACSTSAGPSVFKDVELVDRKEKTNGDQQDAVHSNKPLHTAITHILRSGSSAPTPRAAHQPPPTSIDDLTPPSLPPRPSQPSPSTIGAPTERQHQQLPAAGVLGREGGGYGYDSGAGEATRVLWDEKCQGGMPIE